MTFYQQGRMQLSWAREKLTSMYWALAAAALLTFTYYPGGFYSDVIKQFNWAISISKSLRKGIIEIPSDVSGGWWTVWNTFFRVPFYLLTNEPGLILFVTIVFFFWSGRELCRSLEAELAWLPFICFCTFTPLAGWIVLHGSHIILASCLFVAIAHYLRGRYLSAALFSAGGVLFRPEAVLIALLVPIGLAVTGNLKMWKALIAALIGIIALNVSNWKYPQSSSAFQAPTSQYGLALLTLSVLSQKPNSLADDQTLTLFFNHIPPYDLHCSLSIWCPANMEISRGGGGAINYEALHRPGSLRALIKANLRLAAQEPGLYLTTVIKRMALASSEKLWIGEFGSTELLHLATTSTIRNFLTINMAQLLQRHQDFYNSPFGAVYIPGFLVGRSDVIVISVACLIFYVLKTLIVPDNEIRYYFFEIMFALMLGLISANLIASRFVLGTFPVRTITNSKVASSLPEEVSFTPPRQVRPVAD